MIDEEIQKAAEEIFKDSEYPVPNIYCFIQGAKWALSHQWISVEERLPENDETVLTFSSYGYVLAYYSEQDKMWFAYGNYGDINPTHWMKIPTLSLPKTDTDQND